MHPSVLRQRSVRPCPAGLTLVAPRSSTQSYDDSVAQARRMIRDWLPELRKPERKSGRDNEFFKLATAIVLMPDMVTVRLGVWINVPAVAGLLLPLRGELHPPTPPQAGPARCSAHSHRSVPLPASRLTPPTSRPAPASLCAVCREITPCHQGRTAATSCPT